MVVIDDDVKRVMERRDLDAQEKLILIDLLMREPKPEKVVDEETGQSFKRVGMAIASAEQIAKRTGVSDSVVRDRLKKLKAKGFLDKKGSKGRVGNRWRVKFPKYQKARPATEEESAPATEPKNIQ